MIYYAPADDGNAGVDTEYPHFSTLPSEICIQLYHYKDNYITKSRVKQYQTRELAVFFCFFFIMEFFIMRWTKIGLPASIRLQATLFYYSALWLFCCIIKVIYLVFEINGMLAFFAPMI